MEIESLHNNQSFVLPQVKTQSASRLPARMGDHALSNIRTRINRLSSVIALLDTVAYSVKASSK